MVGKACDMNSSMYVSKSPDLYFFANNMNFLLKEKNYAKKSSLESTLLTFIIQKSWRAK